MFTQIELLDALSVLHADVLHIIVMNVLADLINDSNADQLLLFLLSTLLFLHYICIIIKIML
jgi:hypothetical protein